MPNFITKNVNLDKIPFKSNYCEFAWSAKSGDENIIFTKVGDEKFFLVAKKKNDRYVVKSDKSTRPANLAVVQNALNEFKKEFSEGILSSAISDVVQKNPPKLEFLVEIEDFKKAVENKSKIYLEIGFGSGRHLLYQARNNPDTLIIGIEVYHPSIKQVNNLAKIEGLENIILLKFDARLALFLLDNASVDKIFLHFPIPWEKSASRRVVNSDFAKEASRVLKKGGTFELRSDDKFYTDWTISTFLELKNAQIKIHKNQNLEISSKYEDRWKRQNKDIYDVVFTNEIENLTPKEEYEFDFKDLTLDKVRKDLENSSLKGENSFAHIQRIYEKENGNLVVKLTFGSFYKPEHNYLEISPSESKFLFNKPLGTKENFDSVELIKELIFCKI